MSKIEGIKSRYKFKRLSNIRDLIENTVNNNGEKIAFVLKKSNLTNVELYEKRYISEEEYIKITYNMFYKDIIALSKYILKISTPNDSEKSSEFATKLAVIGKNSYFWMVTYIATLYSDYIIVPLDKSLTNIELNNLLKQSASETLIYDEALEDLISDSTKDLNIENSQLKQKINMSELISIIIDIEEKQKNNEIPELEEKQKNIILKEDDVRIIVYTSGTTSSAKGVMLTQKNIARNTEVINKSVKVYNHDKTLAFLPYHHTLGLTGQLIFIAAGSQTAYCDGLRYVGKNIQEYGCTAFIGVPALIEALYKNVIIQIRKKGFEKKVNKVLKISNFLLKFKIDLRRVFFKSILKQIGGLRVIVSGASALSPEVQKGLIDFGIETIQGYGLTETSPVITVETQFEKKTGSVGVALPEISVEIRDKDEKGIGDIYTKSPCVMKGYYKNEEATKEVLQDGWFKTGDLGYISDNKFLHICGRSKNMIVLKNGKKIFPEELEEKLMTISLIEECFVFGLKEDDDDEKVTVKAKYSEEIAKLENLETEEEIYEAIWKQIKEINKGMPKYKYIKGLIVTNKEFIKTSSNKIKRFEEIKLIQAELEK